MKRLLLALFLCSVVFADAQDLCIITYNLITCSKTNEDGRTVQMQSEERKEFKTMLFDKKLDLYIQFLEMIFQMDDDNLISEDEVMKVENKVGELDLVASEDLIRVCAKFIIQLKAYGVLYTRSMTPKQVESYEKNIGNINDFVSLDELVQAIRRDLSVVDGDVSKVLEVFVDMKYDCFKMIKNPNNVD